MNAWIQGSYGFFNILMYKLLTKLILSLALTVSLAACYKPPPTKNQAKPSSLSMSDHQMKAALLATAQSIDHSLNTLAAAQEASQPALINTAPLITPEGGMGGTADIDWTGPIAPLVHKISQMCDYRMKVLGNEPAIPIIVTINAKNSVLADILQNAGLQAGKRAQLMISPKDKVVELRYIEAERSLEP